MLRNGNKLSRPPICSFLDRVQQREMDIITLNWLGKHHPVFVVVVLKTLQPP
jgi:hypothetical protein